MAYDENDPSTLPEDAAHLPNNERTCERSDPRLTQGCSGFDLEETPQSLGAMAALNVKVAAQSCTRFFDDPIDVRRSLIAKRKRAGHDTPIGHGCSNVIKILDGLFQYVRPSWATDVRQTLPYLMNKQIERLAMLSRETRQ